ncbi:hypothetical protein FNV43_RR03815 [Rhamnella rubrinervis]|uniref:Wax synthase domain-containing protein n=1 Tax=Rhamnella rubrinervis TaxID=2594499 RepID=A0A8K0HKI4_9ROSA|nr:hypothetical protein FNV43_RR03815 [Rhamnella rubrinervis]
MDVDHEFNNFIKVWLSILASLCYCYFIASKLPKGILRLVSILPIFFLFSISPLYLSTVLPTGVTAFFITWLCSFKLLLFCFDLGPLSASHQQKSFFLFLSIACFPIKIRQFKEHPPHQSLQKPLNLEQPAPKLPLNWPTKALILALFVGLHDHTKNLHTNIVLGQYCFMLYFFLDVVLGTCNTLVRALLGIELQSPSNEPYLSTSLQDFWGKRWNLMVSSALRDTVYKPMRTALEPLGSKWAPLPAVLAAFTVSGLMHELIYFYMTRAYPTWEVTCYFVLHGACLVVEFGLKKAFRGKLRLHGAVSGALTLAFVVSTAFWLFFPPLLRNGTDTRAIQECKTFVGFVKEAFNLSEIMVKS